MTNDNPLNRGIKELIDDLRYLFRNRHLCPGSRKAKLVICKGLVRAIRRTRRENGLLF